MPASCQFNILARPPSQTVVRSLKAAGETLVRRNGVTSEPGPPGRLGPTQQATHTRRRDRSGFRPGNAGTAYALDDAVLGVTCIQRSLRTTPTGIEQRLTITLTLTWRESLSDDGVHVFDWNGE